MRPEQVTHKTRADAQLCEEAAITITTRTTQAVRVECLRADAAEAELNSVIIERDAAVAALTKFSKPIVLVDVLVDGSADAFAKNGGRLSFLSPQPRAMDPT